MNLNEQMAKLKPRERFLLFCGLAVVALIVLYLLAAAPVYRWFNNSDEEREELYRQIRESQKITNQVDNVEREFAQYAGYLSTNRPTSSALRSEFSSLIDDLSEREGVAIPNRTMREPREISGGLAEEYVADLEYECAPENLVQFLHALQNAALILRVEKLTVGRKGEGAELLLKGAISISRVVILPEKRTPPTAAKE